MGNQFTEKDLDKVFEIFNDFMKVIGDKRYNLDPILLEMSILLLFVHSNYQFDIHLKEEIWGNYERANIIYQLLFPIMDDLSDCIH